MNTETGVERASRLRAAANTAATIGKPDPVVVVVALRHSGATNGEAWALLRERFGRLRSARAMGLLLLGDAMAPEQQRWPD